MKFFILDSTIFEQKLKPIEFVVYCFLVKCKNNETQTCFPSRATIAGKCCVSLRSVDKAINGLCRKKLIEKENRYFINEYGVPEGKKSNLYKIADLPQP